MSEQGQGDWTGVVRAFGWKGALGLAIVLGVIWWALFGRNASAVDWSKYSPTVKTRIAGEVAAKDCAALQQEFNNAHAADLLAYLDNQMRAAGCYG